MLNELWSQWNLTLQLNEHWLFVQDNHKKKAKQLEFAFDKHDELEKKINQLQDVTSVSRLIKASQQSSRDLI